MRTPLLNQWLVLPPRHPLQARVRADLMAPNPEWVQMIAGGKEPPAWVPETIPLWQEAAEGSLLVPRAYGERIVPTYTDARVQRPITFPAFQRSLRTGQAEFCADLIKQLRAASGVIGQARTGAGKTVMCTNLIFQLGQRTVILVHTGFLMRQWTKELMAAGLKRSQIGWIVQDRCEYGGNKLVSIAMIQTLIARAGEHPTDMYDTFGLVVADECHRLGAMTFRSTITMFPARYRIGVSATPKRKDKNEIVFVSHIGPVVVFTTPTTVIPRIFRIEIPHQLPPALYAQLQTLQYDHKLGYRKKKDNYVKVITYLVNHPRRNARIVRWCVRAVQKGRTTLVLTSRLQHIAELRKAIEQQLAVAGIRAEVGVLRGGMKPEAWAIASGCPLMLGTVQIAKEALDIPTLDTLMLATPMSMVIQPIGRILRQVTGKKEPRVLDFVDRGIGLAEGMARARMREYAQQRWPVHP